MGEGLKKIAKQCGGLVVVGRDGTRVVYDADGLMRKPAFAQQITEAAKRHTGQNPDINPNLPNLTSVEILDLKLLLAMLERVPKWDDWHSDSRDRDRWKTVIRKLLDARVVERGK